MISARYRYRPKPYRSGPKNHMAEDETGDKSIKPSLSGDFSVLQVTAANPESILKNSSWPKQDDNSFGSEEQRPSFSEDNLDSSQISASHYALSTAYSRVKKKLAEAELRNKQMQESLRSQENLQSSKMSGSSHSQANYAMLPNIEASVNQAWEAYNEKCKECQQLREELEQAKQQSDNSVHFSRIQNLEEDVLREKAKQDDVARKLEKTKMEADHLGKKEILAREELEKEREYQKSLIQSAEKKHKEMELRIAELEGSLANEKNLTADLRKREKDRHKAIEDEFLSKKEVFISRVRDVEEENIRLKEEVSGLRSMQHSLNPHQNMNGFRESLPNHTNSPEQDNNHDALALTTDLQLLRGELNELRTRAAEQNHILTALFQNPKIITLIRSSDQLQSKSGTVNGTSDVPIQCSEESLYKRKKTNSAKAPFIYKTKENFTSNDERLVIGSSLPSQDHNGSTTVNSNQLMNHRHPSAKNQGRTNSLSATIVLKPTEEFIQSLGGGTEVRKIARSPMKEYNTLFPPVDVSRVIHNPNSAQTPSSQQRNSQSFSDDFNPMQNSSQNTNQTNPAASATYTPYINGNIPTSTQVLTNGPLTVLGKQDSLSNEDSGIQSNLFHTAVNMPSDTNEDFVLLPPSTRANIRPTNPFYPELGVNGAGQTPQANTHLLNRSLNPGGSPSRSTSTMNRDVPPMLRPSISPSATPPGRIGLDVNELISSDEENENPNSSQQAHSSAHQPKEFIVPKVIHASSLLLDEKNRKAFQDSRHSAQSVDTTRPPTRAKSEAPSRSTQSNSRNTQPEIRAAATPHSYPASGPNNINDDKTRTCPICLVQFGPDWTEQRMNRHINNHFSDEENDMSFD